MEQSGAGQLPAWFWIDLVAALTMLVTIAGVIAERIISKRGFGVRSIQIAAVGMLPPILLVMALEQDFDKSAVFAVIGTFIGYLFSNIGKYDERKVGEDDA